MIGKNGGYDAMCCGYRSGRGFVIAAASLSRTRRGSTNHCIVCEYRISWRNINICPSRWYVFVDVAVSTVVIATVIVSIVAVLIRRVLRVRIDHPKRQFTRWSS